MCACQPTKRPFYTDGNKQRGLGLDTSKGYAQSSLDLGSIFVFIFIIPECRQG
jgi:hypothetical protein